MKSGKSVSLDLAIWLAIENYRKKNNIRDVSAAVEALLKKALKDGGGESR